MAISNEFSKKHQKYIEEFGLEPDLVFVNLKTYETMLTEMENFASGDCKVVYGCTWLPANNMKEDIFFTTTENMDKAIKNYDKNNSEYVFVGIYNPTGDKKVDWDIAQTLIPKAAILAYQNV